MANYAPSVLATAQLKMKQAFNAAELRRKQRPTVAMAIKNGEISIENIQSYKKAEARPIDVFYKLRRAAGATTAKVARHTGTKGDSAKVTLAYNTLVEKFKISRKQAQNNVIGFQEMFQHELDQAISNLMDRAETAAVAYLVANRCQLLAAGLTTSGAGTWNDTNKALEIAAGNKAYFTQFAESFMAGRLYRGSYDAVCDLTLQRAIEQAQSNGAGNATNTAFQFGRTSYNPVVDTILAGYTAGSALIMPKGAFSGLVWNDPANVTGIEEDSYNGSLGTMADPYGSGAIFDVSMYTDRSDESAVGGHAQDFKDEYEISLQLGFGVPPISTANDSAIHLIAQA